MRLSGGGSVYLLTDLDPAGRIRPVINLAVDQEQIGWSACFVDQCQSH